MFCVSCFHIVFVVVVVAVLVTLRYLLCDELV